MRFSSESDAIARPSCILFLFPALYNTTSQRSEVYATHPAKCDETCHKIEYPIISVIQALGTGME